MLYPTRPTRPFWTIEQMKNRLQSAIDGNSHKLQNDPEFRKNEIKNRQAELEALPAKWEKYNADMVTYQNQLNAFETATGFTVEDESGIYSKTDDILEWISKEKLKSN